MNGRLLKIIIELCIIFAVPARAAIRLPELFGDKMVLQRNIDLNIWGWASPKEKVTVRFRGAHYYTEADAAGNWSVTLPPQDAGGPFVLEINERTIMDVLIGDVYLCSGQSNQETPITRLTEKFPEIMVSDNHAVRHFKVPSVSSPEGVKEDVSKGGSWHSGVASEVLNWTSLAYFYALEVYERYKIPVGMVVSSKGGSDIESWISKAGLKQLPFMNIEEEASSFGEGVKGCGVWNAPNYDDTEWATTILPSTWDEEGIDVKGYVLYRKSFELPASMAGRHAKLYMGRMEDSDSVFVNGTFVGTTAYFAPPRVYNVPAGVLVDGENTIAVKLTALNGHGQIVQDKMYKLKGDDDEVDLTGTWKYRIGFNKQDARADAKNNQICSDLYNSMIYPLRNYKFKGVIWYQGENNAGRAGQYASLLTTLIKDWRGLWENDEMPFLLVQLPNYMKRQNNPSESNWARLREAQSQAAAATPFTALAVTYDVGEWNDIHPLDKKTVAQRLFLCARKLIYGEDITAVGPIYKGMERRGNKIIIEFDGVGKGLAVRGDTLRHFAVAGADRKFVWAKAVIKGNKVEVSSPQAPVPVAVRYAWSDNPDTANLCNKDGLLAFPFRTDNW